MAAAREDMGEVPEVHIRPMMELDLPEVAAIEQKSYAFPWSENIFRDCLRVGYTCRALDLAGQVIGYGVMSLGAGEAHILNVCVREEFRSRGVRPPAARTPAWSAPRRRASTRPSSRSGRATWRRSASINDSDSNKSASGAGIIRPPMGAKTPSC